MLSHSAAFSQIGWFWQNPTPQGNYLNDVKFISPNTGWAVGSLGTIIKTTNGGANWVEQIMPGTSGQRDLKIVGNDVYTATVPVTGGLTGLWMALNPGQKTIADVNGNVYNGLSRDPRAYTNLANSPFGAIKVHKDDFIEITSDGVVSTDVASVVAGDYLNAVNAKTILGRTAAASGIPASTTTFVVNYVGYATFPPVKGSVGMTQQKVFGLTCVQE